MPGSKPRGRARSAPVLLSMVTGVAFALGACESALSPQIGLVLSQPSVEFHAVRGSNTPLTQTITVSNSGSGRLGPVTCATQVAWLSCSVTAGTTVTLIANPAGLTQSPALATVMLSAPGAASPSAINVNLKIDQPVLNLSASTVAFTATESGTTTSPATATVAVTNTGVGTLGDLGVILCAPSPANTRLSCTVDQASGILTVSVNPTSLAAGTYVYPITVSSFNAGNQTFAVALTVQALPRMALSRQSLIFSFDRSNLTAQTQTVTVSNIGSGTLGTISCVSPASWLTCSVTGSTVSLTANPLGLSASPAPIDVTISAANAINTPLTVSVALTLTEPVLRLSSDTLTFSVIQGTLLASPDSASITARAASGAVSSLGTITCTVPGSPPISCTVSDSTITVAVTDASALSAGVYVYPVTVSATNSSITRTISVTLYVKRPVLGATPTSLQMTGATSATVQVSNLGAGGALVDLGMIACSTSAADVTCSIDQATGVVTLTTVPGSLAAGTYVRTAALTSAYAQNSQTITIVWTVP
jgi:hypothetical protein